MAGLGFFLFLAMLVYIIDKNNGWPKFWRVAKALILVCFVAVLVWGASVYWHQRSIKSVDYRELAAKFGVSTAGNSSQVVGSVDSTLTVDQFMNEENVNDWLSRNAPGGLVPISENNGGGIRYVEPDRVNDLLARGSRLATWNKDSRGRWCLLSPLPQGSTLDECPVPKFDPNAPYSKAP